MQWELTVKIQNFWRTKFHWVLRKKYAQLFWKLIIVQKVILEIVQFNFFISGFDESHRESTRKRDRPSSFPQIEEYILKLFDHTEKQG